MIQGKQALFGERGKELSGKERIAICLMVDQLRQWHDSMSFTVQRVCNQVPEMFFGKWPKRDFTDVSAGVADCFELPDQSGVCINLIVPIGTNQQQMP